MATTGYFASAQTNDLSVGIAQEAIWGTAPTGTYEAMRLQSFGLNEAANRTRPSEIRNDMQASPSVLQDVAASGQLQFAVSYGNQDTLWSTLFTNDWGTDVAISDGGIDADNASSQFGASIGVFNDVVVGQWIRVAGFTTEGANGYYRVTAKAGDGSTITVTPAPASDVNAGADTITITGSLLANSTVVNTLSIQERYSATLGFLYTGCLATAGQINAARGEFFSGTVDLTARGEEKAESLIGSMGPLPAERVLNTVGNMKALVIGSLTDADIMSLTTTITREGAGADYAMRTPNAIGVRPGTFMASGQVEIYFKDYAVYDEYKAESQLNAYYQVFDASGNGYIVDFPLMVLGSVTRERGGPNQPVMATFDFMAEPSAAEGTTMTITRFAAA